MPCPTSLPAIFLLRLSQPDLAEGDIWIAQGTGFNPLDIGLEELFVRAMKEHYCRRVVQN
jgi:hypothetical protein